MTFRRRVLRCNPVRQRVRRYEAGLNYRPPDRDVDEIATGLLSPGGRMAEEKTFTPRDVIVAVAPYLHGLPVSVLDAAMDSVLSHERAVPLPPVAGAREPVWSAACVLEDERRIAELADALTQREGPRVDESAQFRPSGR